MKIRLLGLISVISVLISLFAFCANAQVVDKFNIDFSLPDEFVVLTEDNISDNTDAIKSLGFTEDTFKNYINANNIVLFASLPDKSCQLTVNVNKTEFTENTENLEYLDDEYIARILPKLIGERVAFNEIKVINDSKFIRIQKSGIDKAGEFSFLQYITVKNKQLYTVTISFSDNVITSTNIDYAENLMKKFVVSSQKEKITIQNVQNVTVYIVLILIIIFLCAVCIYFIATIVNDILKSRNTSDVAPYVKIKRRRFK